jgi:Zn-dependent peptidase ImmA (M78 family)
MPFSLPFADRPVVVLSTEKTDRARSRFEAAHALGHLIMHGEQIWGVAELEKQAHTFAAALAPRADQIRDPLPQTVDWPRLFALKQHWQGVARRLAHARPHTRRDEREHLLHRRQGSLARDWRRVEPLPLGVSTPPPAARVQPG